jgi:hypothetical protein
MAKTYVFNFGTSLNKDNIAKISKGSFSEILWKIKKTKDNLAPQVKYNMYGFHQSIFGKNRPLRVDFLHILVCVKFYWASFGMNIFFQKSIFFQKNDNLVRVIVFLAKIEGFLSPKLANTPWQVRFFLNERHINSSDDEFSHWGSFT